MTRGHLNLYLNSTTLTDVTFDQPNVIIKDGGGMYLRVLSGVLVALVVSMGGARSSYADEKVDHTEIPSPSGKRVAILDGYHDGILAASGGFYVVLTIKEGDLSVTVGRLPVGGNPVWLSEDRLRVTIGQMGKPSIPSSVLGVDIVLHIGDQLHAESVRERLEGYERSGYNSPNYGPNSVLWCELQHRNWEEARSFWAWARRKTDNGDPDPGPWVNKYYPQDCSTLKQP